VQPDQLGERLDHDDLSIILVAQVEDAEQEMRLCRK
jgi:hypothetical protein